MPVSAPFQPAWHGADHARARVGEEQHAAIGAGDAEREAEASRVTSPSQRGRASAPHGSSTISASAE